MIEKERLEELMKNNGKIYHIIEFNGECAVEKNKAVDFNAVDLLYSLMNGDKNKWFETKEDAEWALEFGNITRTETLNLPSWEELKQKINSNGYGNKTIANFDNYIFEYKRTKTQVVLGINLGCETLFYGVLSLANYTEACKLAKKLFLGEVEE